MRGDPFDKWSNVTHDYVANDANEYTPIPSWSGKPSHDKNGNMMELPTITSGSTVTTLKPRYTAQNQIHTTDNPNNTNYDRYRYDALGRRIGEMGVDSSGSRATLDLGMVFLGEAREARIGRSRGMTG